MVRRAETHIQIQTNSRHATSAAFASSEALHILRIMGKGSEALRCAESRRGRSFLGLISA